MTQELMVVKRDVLEDAGSLQIGSLMQTLRETIQFRKRDSLSPQDLKVQTVVRVYGPGKLSKRRVLRGDVERQDFQLSMFPVYGRAVRSLEDNGITVKKLWLDALPRIINKALVFTFRAE